MEMDWKGISEIEQAVRDERRRRGMSKDEACMVRDYKYYLDNVGFKGK